MGTGAHQERAQGFQIGDRIGKTFAGCSGCAALHFDLVAWYLADLGTDLQGC
jgi:hypothetical protein